MKQRSENAQTNTSGEQTPDIKPWQILQKKNAQQITGCPKEITLVLANRVYIPIAWKGSLTQYVGRIQRQFEGKDKVMVFDYVDQTLPTLQRMYQKRVKGYKTMGYTITEKGKDQLLQAPLNLEESQPK